MAVAIWGAFGAVAGAAGPTLGALVVEHLGWRWAFYINLPVGIVSFVLGWQGAPGGQGGQPRPPARRAEHRPPRQRAGARRLRHRPHRASGAGRARRSSSPSWSPRRSSPRFILRCRQVTNPLLDLRLFQSPSFRWANAGMFAYAIGFNAMFLGNVLFLTEVWGYSIMRAGMAHRRRPADRRRHRPAVRQAGGAHRPARPADPRRSHLGVRTGVPAPPRDHHAGLRRRLPPIHRAHRDRRGARAAAAVLGVGARTSRPTSSARARRSTRRCATSPPRSAWPSWSP